MKRDAGRTGENLVLEGPGEGKLNQKSKTSAFLRIKKLEKKIAQAAGEGGSTEREEEEDDRPEISKNNKTRKRKEKNRRKARRSNVVIFSLHELKGEKKATSLSTDAGTGTKRWKKPKEKSPGEKRKGASHLQSICRAPSPSGC